RGVPEHIRSDNGPEFTAKAVRRWLNRVGVKTLFIEPGSPWENGYVKSFNSKPRDEFLNGEVFTTLTEAGHLMLNTNHYFCKIVGLNSLSSNYLESSAISCLAISIHWGLVVKLINISKSDIALAFLLRSL
ncbi:integrase core domain-containing protein, partial [Chloroflexota bacterium]